MRSSMRRSTPAIGEAAQGIRPAWIATRREKSVLSSILPPAGGEPAILTDIPRILGSCVAQGRPQRKTRAASAGGGRNSRVTAPSRWNSAPCPHQGIPLLSSFIAHGLAATHARTGGARNRPIGDEISADAVGGIGGTIRQLRLLFTRLFGDHHV